MNKYIKNILPAAALVLSMGITSCTDDLDVTPLDDSRQTTYDADALFTKCYSVLALEGNAGADDASDIDGMDGGMSGFFRQMWNSNELTTDEAICWWGDAGIPEYNTNDYGPEHPMLNGYYSRLTTAITYANTFLKAEGGNDQTRDAEVRFLRAFEYYMLMDAFGNIPFSLEPLATPDRKTRAEMYEWIEQEVLEIEPMLSDAKAKKSTDVGYGRVDKAAAWFLLMRLYLNAEVYTGTAQWAKAAEYAQKVINSPYKLNTQGAGGWSAYQMLFLGDNGETNAAYECVFPLMGDGVWATGYANAFFTMASCYDSDMHENPFDPAETNGSSDGNWGGNRARPQLVRKFIPNDDAPELTAYEMATVMGDDRALFNNIGHTLSTEDNTSFKQGYGVAKYKNFKTDGSKGHDPKFSDIDVFLFRVAEAYMTYAEALLRQGQPTEALKQVNIIRSRANAAPLTALTLDTMLDEWSREFYFEGRRRVDLIRFGKFGGDNDYNWEWKGGTLNGRNFGEYKNIFAIPANQVRGAIIQNPGYPTN